MPYAERTISCRDCGRSFPFTIEEQEFFAKKGFTNDPVRCPECRAARKAERGESRGSGGFGREPRKMFPAVCASCGKDTEVPFEPRGDRPVYCSDCYSRERGSYGRSY